MNEKKLGLQTRKERKEIALKRFMRCEACLQPMRGYIANSCDTPEFNTLTQQIYQLDLLYEREKLHPTDLRGQGNY